MASKACSMKARRLSQRRSAQRHTKTSAAKRKPCLRQDRYRKNLQKKRDATGCQGKRLKVMTNSAKFGEVLTINQKERLRCLSYGAEIQLFLPLAVGPPHPRKDPYCWSPADSRVEVDFLLLKGNRFVDIESKSSSRVRPEDFLGHRAIGNLPGLKRRLLLYSGATSRVTDDGVEILSVGDFLNTLANSFEI